MNKISAQRIQAFIAGTLSFWGFWNLLSIPSAFVGALSDNFYLLALLVSSLAWSIALLVGIALLIGTKHAIRYTSIFLWSWFGLNLFAIFAPYLYRALGWKPAHVSLWHSIYPLLITSLLLSLFLWSRSKEQTEQDA